MRYVVYPLSGIRKEAGVISSLKNMGQRIGKKLYRAKIGPQLPGESALDYRIRRNVLPSTSNSFLGKLKMNEIRNMDATRRAAHVDFAPPSVYVGKTSMGNRSNLFNLDPKTILSRGKAGDSSAPAVIYEHAGNKRIGSVRDGFKDIPTFNNPGETMKIPQSLSDSVKRDLSKGIVGYGFDRPGSRLELDHYFNRALPGGKGSSGHWWDKSYQDLVRDWMTNPKFVKQDDALKAMAQTNNLQSHQHFY